MGLQQDHTSYLSPYLRHERTATSRRSDRPAHTWQQRLYARLRLLPTLSSRTTAGLALWLVLFSIGLYAFQHQTLPPLPADVAAADGAATPTTLKAFAKAASLPSGPSGQLLPPGTMATEGTFRNGYTRGQCTWYVASRRPVPANWGHARTWYPRAQAAGWATGTTPAIAAIAWTSQGYYGHVALVEAINSSGTAVLISEMNYTGPYQRTKRWVAASTFKYIY